MTQGEFAKGWKLLILQPWGWRYRSLTADGRPTEESGTQMAFYYDKLKWAHPEAWWKVADLFAQGDKWPSVYELKQATQQINAEYVRGIADHREPFEPMPAEVRAVFERMKEGKSMDGSREVSR